MHLTVLDKTKHNFLSEQLNNGQKFLLYIYLLTVNARQTVAIKGHKIVNLSGLDGRQGFPTFFTVDPQVDPLMWTPSSDDSTEIYFVLMFFFFFFFYKKSETIITLYVTSLHLIYIYCLCPQYVYVAAFFCGLHVLALWTPGVQMDPVVKA